MNYHIEIVCSNETFASKQEGKLSHKELERILAIKKANFTQINSINNLAIDTTIEIETKDNALTWKFNITRTD